MPRDVVIVPTYDRPEYLAVCLEYLSEARGIADKEIWICQDNHVGAYPEPGVLAVFQSRGFLRARNIEVKCTMRSAHNYYGNSVNIFKSLKQAVETGAERIFLVEDDIMVMPDFFEWHEEVLAAVNPFVSCGTAVNKSAHFPINGRYAQDETFQDAAAVYLSESAYSSHAIAIKKENAKVLVEVFANEKIYESLEPGFEQDIMIQKFLVTNKLKSAWPYVPRAYNVGMRSYHINTGMRVNGTPEEKRATLKAIIKDPIRLANMACGNQAVTPVPTAIPARTEPIYAIQRYR